MSNTIERPVGIPITTIKNLDGSHTYLVRCPTCEAVCHLTDNEDGSIMVCQHDPQVPESMKTLPNTPDNK